MAGFVPNPWAARLLEATVGKTAITAGNVYFGLAWSMPEDILTATLATINEVDTPGYARKQIPAFDAASLVAPIRITTPTEFAFDALTEDMTVPAGWAFITDAAAGTAGDIRYIIELETPVLGRLGVPLSIPASTLVIE